MDRLQKIWQAGAHDIGGMMADNAQMFHNELDKDATIAEGFVQHFAYLFQILAVQQSNNEKGLLRYITLSLLKSSIVAETYEIAITCHTNDLFMDETETETYWRMDFIKDMINKDMERIVPKLEKEISRIREYEIEEFRTIYAIAYTALLLTFLSRVLHRVFDLPEFHTVQKEDLVDITFGEYMEEAVPLVQYGGEGE